MSLPRQSLVVQEEGTTSTTTSRRRRAPPVVHIPQGTHLLVRLHQEDQNNRTGKLVLCQARSAIDLYNEDDSIAVHIDATVQVESTADHIKPKDDSVVLRLYNLQYDSRQSYQAILKDASSSETAAENPRNNSATGGVVTILPTTSTPILSLVLTLEQVEPPLSDVDTDKGLPPLLSSCLKSQLVGLHLLWNKENNTHSVIHIHLLERRYTLRTTQSLYISPSTSFSPRHRIRHNHDNSNPCIYQILPQTKITITSSRPAQTATTSVESSTPPSLILSPTAQYLVDTLWNVIQQSSTSTNQIPLMKCILLYGGPGTGKTFAVTSAAAHVQADIVAVEGSHILGAHVGEAAVELERMLSVPQKQPPTILFLDEVDALFVGYSKDTLSSALAASMDQLHSSNAPSILVAATNRVDVIPPAVRRRFDHVRALVPPGPEERYTVLRTLLEQTALVDHFDDEIVQSVARDAVGCVPADLAAMVRQATLAYLQQPNHSSNHNFGDCLQRAAAMVGASALRDAVVVPTTTWDDVCGPAGGAKHALQQAVQGPRTRPAAYRALQLTPPAGILLYGPPGCAKTTLARAAAGAAGVAFLTLAPADVYASSYVGDAEAIVRRAFALARAAAPCILFFDELDAIVGTGGEDGDGGPGAMARGTSAEARVLSTFLNEMDGVDTTSLSTGVLVLGATNRPWTLDAALLRPGRLDKIIYVPPPDSEARKALLQQQTKGWPIFEDDNATVSQDFWERLVELTEFMTGAEIVGACRDAARVALRQLETKDDEKTDFCIRRSLLESLLRDVVPLLQNEDALDQFQRFEAYHKR